MTAPPAGPAGPAPASFDVVRVEPTGEAVVAGRADPHAEVALLDSGKVVAKGTADAAGQFVILPPTLAEGEHSLTLQAAPPGGQPAASAQSVAVSVAKAASARPLVAVLTPDQPPRILSDGAPLAPAITPGGGKTPAVSVPLAIQSVEAAQGGQFTASGVARAGSQCRVYLNGAFLADVTASQDGHWSVKIGRGMQPGRYTVRADEIEAGSGKVVNRAEVPFDYPAVTALSGTGRRQLMSGAGSAPTAPSSAQAVVASSGPQAAVEAATDAGGTLVSNLQTARVIRGDSLWRISRKMLGHGVNYTEIYASNAKQIRDPKLIYPGQIFVVPNRTER